MSGGDLYVPNGIYTLADTLLTNNVAVNYDGGAAHGPVSASSTVR